MIRNHETRDSIMPSESAELLAELDRPTTSHARRAAIGDRLNALGDPRPGVGLTTQGLPDIAWCPVPAGEVTLEDGAGTFQVAPFYIGKYPVTWAQYRCFLTADDGYTRQSWWLGLAKRTETPGEQFRQIDNHPAENVSWYDAIAYSRWLSAQLGYEVRLLTEWEWQHAATGGHPAYDYPWGADWDPERANTYASGLSRSTAVGMYPHGASPVGALDMSGNVLEWCLNTYEDSHPSDDSGEPARMVRGGSWFDNPFGARAPYRDDYDPQDRGGSVGVRLMCSSPNNVSGSDRAVRGGSWFDLPSLARAPYRVVYGPQNRDVSVGVRLVCSSPSLSD